MVGASDGLHAARVTSEEVGYKLRDQIRRGAECLACLTNKEEIDHLILCDGCGHGFHLECLGLTTTPPGAWLCPWCVGEPEAFPTDVCRTHPLRYLHLLGLFRRQRYGACYLDVCRALY